MSAYFVLKFIIFVMMENNNNVCYFVFEMFVMMRSTNDVTPQIRGFVDYSSTRRIQVDVGLPDATSENRAESPLYGELYPSTIPAYICPKQCNIIPT